MATDLALQPKRAFDPVIQNGGPVRVDNDNSTLAAGMSELDLSALAREAAWGLVKHHRNGREVAIRSRGNARFVFEDISRQLMAFGTGRVIAEHLAQSLVDETLQKTEAFRRKVGQNYIGVSAVVSDAFQQDMYQFESGHTEVIVIDKNTTDVAGSSGVEVRLTASGTATTSNRADIGQIFASVKKWGLYIVQEAPGKEELDGIDVQSQTALSALGVELSVAVDAGDLQAVLDQVSEMDFPAPDIQELVQNLMTLQNLVVAGHSPENISSIESLVQTIQQNLTQAVQDKALPSSFTEGVIDFVQNLSETHNLSSVIDMTLFEPLQVQGRIDILTSLFDDELVEIIQQLTTLEGLPAELAEILEAIDIQNISPEILKEALNGQNELSGSVKTIILALNDPGIQSALPASLLLSEDTLSNLQAMSVVTALPEEARTVIAEFLEMPTMENLQTVSRTLGDTAPPQISTTNISVPSVAVMAAQVSLIAEVIPSSASIQNETSAPVQQRGSVEALKSVAQTLSRQPEGVKISPAKAEIIIRRIDQARPVIQKPVIARQIDMARRQVIQHTDGGAKSIPKPVVTGQAARLTGPVSERISIVYQKPAVGEGVQPVRGVDIVQNTQINQAPSPLSEGRDILRVVQETIGQQKEGIRLSAEEKKPLEAFKSVERIIEKIEQSEADTIPPYEAEVILRKLDEGLTGVQDEGHRAIIEQLREDVMDHTEGGRDEIPKDVQAGRCPGCAGGSCAGCAGDQKVAAAGAAARHSERGVTIAPRAQTS